MFMARLAQLPHDAQSQQLIGELDASVQALQDLLDALLDISRLEAKAVQVHLRPFALVKVFEQIRDALGLTAIEKGLRLRIRPTEVWLQSDSTLLHRMVLNLVVNAVRYTSVGGVLLACRVAADGRQARIEVWDSGIGIAPEHHESIFKEFYQVGNAERDRSKGLGLGLNIVARSAQLLGHRLQMCSRPGRGSRFSIEVPLASPDAAVDRRGPLRATTFDNLAGLRVLVIEDEPQGRQALVSLLASWGVRVSVAEGLLTACQQMENGAAPDVIVSDYRLRNGENGIEVIRQLRVEAGRLIPACLISGDTDPNLLQTVKQAALTLLHKPVRPAKLRNLIRRLTLVP
jgi:CheY-like chemotaxis protein/two-component sensor histidine kinase